MTQVTEADRKVTAAILGYASWADATDYRLSGVADKERDETLSIIIRFREQAVQEAVAERDARIEGLTIERNFHRETADLHAARIAELRGALEGLLIGLNLLPHGDSNTCKTIVIGTPSKEQMNRALAALQEIDNDG